MEQREEVLNDDVTVRSYVAGMRRSGKWGSGIEALCGAYVYGRPVHVYSPDGFSALEPPPSLAHGSGEPIRMLHNGRNHWDSLFPLELPAGGHGRPEPPSKPAMVMRNGVLQPQEVAGAGSGSAAAQAQEEEALRRQNAMAFSSPRGGSAAAQAHDFLFGSAAPAVAKAPEPAEDLPRDAPLDDVAAQRRARAAAAEARMQQASNRGLGAAGKAKAKAKAPASRTFVAAPRAEPSAPQAEPAACASASAGGRWQRRHAAHDSPGTSTEGRCDAGTHAQPVLVLRPPSAAPADLDKQELEECIASLQRLGMSVEEATDVVVSCDGDIERVKELYCVEWDGQGRTMQLAFQS